jgi:3-dehydroquinate synthase
MKRDIVGLDERESGPRRLLNLGHTFAHAIETLSGYSVSHGRAVAAGVVMAAKASSNAGMMSRSDAARIEALAAAMGFETSYPYALADMREAMLADKKAAAGAVDFVLPLEIGKCTVKNVSPSEISWEG